MESTFLIVLFTKSVGLVNPTYVKIWQNRYWEHNIRDEFLGRLGIPAQQNKFCVNIKL